MLRKWKVFKIDAKYVYWRHIQIFPLQRKTFIDLFLSPGRKEIMFIHEVPYDMLLWLLLALKSHAFVNFMCHRI